MAIALDTTLIGAVTGNGVNSIVLSNFSTGGTNRLVLVEIDQSKDASTVSSVTATGLTFTKVVSLNKGTANGNVEVWGAWAASTQTNVAITVNFTGTNNPQSSARTHCFSGTDATGTVAATIGATNSVANFSPSSTTPSTSIVTTRANSLVIGVIGVSKADTISSAGSGWTNDGTTSLAAQFTMISSLRSNAATTTTGTTVTVAPTISAADPSALFAIELLTPGLTISVSDSSTVTESVTVDTFIPVDETLQSNWIIGVKIWNP